ncbi:MAG: family permease [Deltaproteobacteria bacterium]|nr:family permease [Deltaproteobacteria bacterium]
MTWQGWFTLAVLFAVIIAMALETAGPEVLLMGALFTLAAAGVLTPEETFAGFSNQSMATIGALLVLAAALRNTGAMEATFGRVFGRTRHELGGLLRFLFPVAAASAFLNNTTIVAMTMPVVIDWARRNRLSPARFLIPLSYATILGGVITMIGTSTNLTVAGLMLQAKMPPMGFFELAPVGVPVCVVGLAYLLTIGRRLLPDRKDPTQEFGERQREYTVAMMVAPASPLAGQSIEDAGLRHLPGLFLVEIERGDTILSPVASDEILRAGDRLVFAGLVSTIVDLQRFRGLLPATETTDPAALAPERSMIEAVISNSSPLVGQSVRDANFRTVYDAAVIAVHRNGERVRGKIGDIRLRPGDTLLLRAAPGFLRAHHNSSDFYLVSEVADSEPPRYDRSLVALGVLAALIVVVTFDRLPISIAAFLAAGVLILTRCVSAAQAHRSVEWPLLIVIGAAFGLATAMEKTGVAAAIARAFTPEHAALGPRGALAAIYFLTVLLTEGISNNAAAALMFPIGVATAQRLGVDARGFIMAISVAASCGFAIPFGYQTHLIVYGPGGYHFRDFVRVGLPLDLACGLTAVAVIPMVWPF